MMRSSFLAVFALLLCGVLDGATQTGSTARGGALPMLKTGNREAYVQFSRPKITVGLAMILPPEAGYREQVVQGFNSVVPDPDAEDVSLYFRTASDLIVTSTGTFYVAVEYLDQGRAAMELEYMRETDDERRKQRERFFLGGSGNWQRHVFVLRDAILNGSFPAETDFRIINANIPLRRVSISRVPPAGPGGPVGPIFQQPVLNLPSGFLAGVMVDDTIPDSDWRDERRLESRAQLYRSWGANAIINTVRPREAYRSSNRQWDASIYRTRAELLNRMGLQWTPRLAIGVFDHLPVALTADYQRAMTTDGGASGPMMSLWEPRMVQLYDAFLADLRRRLGAFSPQMLVLSVAGDWGPLLLSHEMGGQAIRPDSWAGDPHARRSFAEFVRQRYGALNALRNAWDENVLSWDQALPTPSGGKPQKAADVDEWLRSSLTDVTTRLVQSVKRHFPNARIIIEIGDDFQYNAVDVSALTRLAASNQASVLMVTQEPNPTDHYAWQWLATASRERGNPFGLRIHRGAYRQDLLGVLYALASENSNMIIIHEDDLSAQNAWEQYTAAMQGWRASAPVRQAAVIYPRYAAANSSAQEFVRLVKEMRELFAFDLIDESTLERISPTQYPLLIAPWGDVWSDGAFRALDRLVRGGAVLLVRSPGPWRDLQGRTQAHNDLFNVDLRREGDQWVAQTRGLRDQPYQQQSLQPVERIVLPLGSPAAGGYLTGQWSEPLDRRSAERFGMDFSTFRWLSERGGARFMMQPRKDYTLHIEGFLPQNQSVQVNVNGRPFGIIEGKGYTAWKADLIGQWRPQRPQLDIELRGRTWSTGQVLGATQPLQVSMAVHRIGVTPRGEELSASAVEAGIQAPQVGWANLPGAWVRDRGRGYTIFIPSSAMNEWAFAELASTIMSNPALIEPRLRFNAIIDGRRDGVFISPQRGAAVYYNSNRQPAQIPPAQGRGAGIVLPPRSIVYR